MSKGKCICCVELIKLITCFVNINIGLSVITLDNEFQERRRITSARNRPRHAVYGVTTGATSLVTSVASGITGVLVYYSLQISNFAS